MNGTTQQEERFIQKLHDAEGSHEFVESFIDTHMENNLSKQIRLLAEHRSKILNNVRKEQSNVFDTGATS